MGQETLVALAAIVFFFVIFSPGERPGENPCDNWPFSGDEEITAKSDGDGDFELYVENAENGYVKHQFADVHLLGKNESHQFSRFMVSLKLFDPNTGELKHGRTEEVGKLQPVDEWSMINSDCDHSVSETAQTFTAEQKLAWFAPNKEYCVAITARVYRSKNEWYANDGKLTSIICAAKDRSTDEGMDEEEIVETDDVSGPEFAYEYDDEQAAAEDEENIHNHDEF